MKEHLMQRGVDVETNRIWFNEEVAVFPLWNFAGALCGYQQYRPNADKKAGNPKDARYFTRLHSAAVWGTERQIKGSLVYLTEGIFKSAALHRAGFNSWAVLGSTVNYNLLQQLLLLPFTFRCVGDNDLAGQKFSRTFNNGCVSPVDLDEMTTDEIAKLLEDAA